MGCNVMLYRFAPTLITGKARRVKKSASQTGYDVYCSFLF